MRGGPRGPKIEGKKLSPVFHTAEGTQTAEKKVIVDQNYNEKKIGSSP